MWIYFACKISYIRLYLDYCCLETIFLHRYEFYSEKLSQILFSFSIESQQLYDRGTGRKIIFALSALFD